MQQRNFNSIHFIYAHPFHSINHDQSKHHAFHIHRIIIDRHTSTAICVGSLVGAFAASKKSYCILYFGIAFYFCFPAGLLYMKECMENAKSRYTFHAVHWEEKITSKLCYYVPHRDTDTKYNRNENTADSLGLFIILIFPTTTQFSPSLHCMQHTTHNPRIYFIIASKHFYSLAIIRALILQHFHSNNTIISLLRNNYIQLQTMQFSLCMFFFALA